MFTLFLNNINTNSNQDRFKTDGLFIRSQETLSRWWPKDCKKQTERRKNMNNRCISNSNNTKKISSQHKKQFKHSIQTTQFQIIQQL